MSTPTTALSGPGVHGREDRTQRLGEHDRGASVEQAVGLGVALDRHRGDQPLGTGLDDLDAHPGVQGARVERLHLADGGQHLVRGTEVMSTVIGAPLVLGGVSRLRLGCHTCRHCSSSMDTRWPTARSTRCRRRTSRPSTGQNTNAVYGFTSMLINMLRDEQPTHIAVAFDKSRQTFRSEEYAEYKAGRSATPTEFSGQIPLVHEVLGRCGSRSWSRRATRPTTSSRP
jgi:hypothetical protein